FGDERRHRVDHRARRGRLHPFARDATGNLQPLQIARFTERDKPRAKWAEGVEALAPAELTPRALLLPPSGADVVGAADTQDATERVGLGHVSRWRAENHRKLGLEIDLLRAAGLRVAADRRD